MALGTVQALMGLAAYQARARKSRCLTCLSCRFRLTAAALLVHHAPGLLPGRVAFLLESTEC